MLLSLFCVDRLLWDMGPALTCGLYNQWDSVREKWFFFCERVSIGLSFRILWKCEPKWGGDRTGRWHRKKRLKGIMSSTQNYTFARSLVWVIPHSCSFSFTKLWIDKFIFCDIRTSLKRQVSSLIISSWYLLAFWETRKVGPLPTYLWRAFLTQALAASKGKLSPNKLYLQRSDSVQVIPVGCGLAASCLLIWIFIPMSVGCIACLRCWEHHLPFFKAQHSWGYLKNPSITTTLDQS